MEENKFTPSSAEEPVSKHEEARWTAVLSFGPVLWIFILSGFAGIFAFLFTTVVCLLLGGLVVLHYTKKSFHQKNLDLGRL